MITVRYSEEFIRAYNKLPVLLRADVDEKIVLFKNREHHRRLRVHKLHGEHAACWSFSANYRFRIIFVYVGKKKNDVVLITVGDHSIYD